MDWILDHLQLIFVIAGSIAYWLNARRKEKAGEPADYDGDGQPDTLPGGGGAMREYDQAQEQAEATRRIQDEIRRKIAERSGQPDSRGGASLPTWAPTPPALPPRTAHRPEPTLAPYAREERRQEVERESALVLERQRALAEQLAALKARKAEAGRVAKAVWRTEAVADDARRPVKAREELSLLTELSQARSLRKAIILREVLGTPVALR